ncbi:DUF4198 domain-containing protein [Novosphingobium sp. RD2P27]|uniref:DUF4198 domain-containing protein n=1 Tax=Novosphingobium kalidii TaxID=3230299 RepID=A0ABV2CZI9_9SPHN
MRCRHALFAAAALAAILSSPASAHRQWLLPSTTSLSGTSEWVTVDAAVSNDLFYADHVPMSPEQVKVWAPDGIESKIENAATGRYRSTFDVKIDKPGTWAIGTERNGVMGTFKLNGETWRVGGRGRPATAPGAGAPGGANMQRPQGAAPTAAPARPQGSGPIRMVANVEDIPAGATDINLTEVLAKNMVFVTADAPTMTVLEPTGKGLEFQPLTHPASLVSDEPARFRFLVDGKPAAGVNVTVVPGGKKFREAEEAQELKTDADGVVTVQWPVPGVYWLNASAEDAKASTPRADKRRMGFTTTLEVVAP